MINGVDKRMKNVLMIAHQFPPIGGSGVQRTAKFIKYLPEFGWKGSVITRQVKKSQLTDGTLNADIPKDTGIFRSPSWDLSEWVFPFNLAGKFIRRRVLIPDGERLWEIFSIRKALDIIKHGEFQMLYSSSQPFSTHLLAVEIKKNYPKIPWVADFRDEWTNNAFVKAYHYNAFRVKKEIKMERKVFEMADAVVINTPFMRDNSIRDNPDLEHKFHVIPNGFDREDFEGLSHSLKNKKFTLTYTGLIYGNTSPETLFRAVSKLMRENKVDPDKIILRFIGRFKTETLYKMAKACQVSEMIETLPYMPHRESIRYLLGSDVVLLLLGEGTEAIYTGKLMEYLNTGKPILASVPAQGAAAMLIQETKTGLAADCDDVDTTAQHFLSLYEKWEKGQELFKPDREKISQYERRTLTKKLAEIFDGLC